MALADAAQELGGSTTVIQLLLLWHLSFLLCSLQVQVPHTHLSALTEALELPSAAGSTIHVPTRALGPRPPFQLPAISLGNLQVRTDWA
jgi:hypothetical protein